MNENREYKENRVRLVDTDLADLILILKFVITGTGAEHTDNIRAKKLMKRFLSHIELSKRGSAISSLIQEDISRIRLDDLI